MAANGRNLIERVSQLIVEVSSTVLEPRYAVRQLEQVREKSPGEVVTGADDEAERLLSAGLAAALPAPVVGEEACASEPGRLHSLGADRCWLVDPLDGTANFINGSDDWAVMVALLERGAPVASWIWQPVSRRMYVAEQGAGAYRDGSPIRCGPRPRATAELRGAALVGFLDPATAGRVQRNARRFAHVAAGRRCSGVDYPEIIEGTQDFVLFWRTLPWDHVPGALLVEEAGGIAARLDGTRYSPMMDGAGLLVAADTETWAQARTLLK